MLLRLLLLCARVCLECVNKSNKMFEGNYCEHFNVHAVAHSGGLRFRAAKTKEHASARLLHIPKTIYNTTPYTYVDCV